MGPSSTSERFIHQGLLKRFPSVQSVVHSHSRAVIPFGIGGVPFQPTYHLAGGFIGQSAPLFLPAARSKPISLPPRTALIQTPPKKGEEAPVFEIADYYTPNDTQNLLVNKPRFGQALANTFLTPAHNATTPDDVPAAPDYNLVLQRGHGFTTTGASIPQAVYRAVYTTWNAEVQTTAITINDAAAPNRGVRYIAQRELADTAALEAGAYTRDWMLWAAQVGVNPLYKNDLGYAAIPEPMTSVTKR